MRSVLVLVFSMAAFAGDAVANLYKCASPGGRISYQAEPCGGGAEESRIKAPIAEPSERGPAGVALVDVGQAARRISSRVGRPTVVMLYSTGCSLSQQAFPQFVALANRYRGRGVEFVVLSADEGEDVAGIPGFLAQRNAPFEPLALKPWADGQLSRAFQPLGIEIGSRWTMPLIALRDRDGRVVRKTEGVTDLSRLGAALEALAR